MKLRLRSTLKEERCVFVFDESEQAKIQWEGSDEFVYGNIMYDILEKHYEGNKLIVHAVNDHKESRLLADFKKANRQHPGKETIVLYQLVFAPFLPVASIDIIVFPLRNKMQVPFTDTRFPATVSEIILPPPQGMV